MVHGYTTADLLLLNWSWYWSYTFGIGSNILVLFPSLQNTSVTRVREALKEEGKQVQLIHILQTAQKGVSKLTIKYNYLLTYLQITLHIIINQSANRPTRNSFIW